MHAGEKVHCDAVFARSATAVAGWTKLETVFMIPSLDTTYISASLVREIARYGGDVSSLVHPATAVALRAKTASQ